MQILIVTRIKATDIIKFNVRMIKKWAERSAPFFVLTYMPAGGIVTKVLSHMHYADDKNFLTASACRS